MDDKKLNRSPKLQYEFLMECGESGDVTPWNEWRARNPQVKPNLEGKTIQSAPDSPSNLNGINLKSAKLKSTRFQYVKLADANFAYADFRGARISSAVLSRATFWGANFIHTEFQSVDLKSAVFPHVRLTHASLIDVELGDSEWGGSTWFAVHLNGCDFTAARFADVKVLQSTFRVVTLDNADFRDTALYDCGFLACDLSRLRHSEHTRFQARCLFDTTTIELTAESLAKDQRNVTGAVGMT